VDLAIAPRGSRGPRGPNGAGQIHTRHADGGLSPPVGGLGAVFGPRSAPDARCGVPAGRSGLPKTRRPAFQCPPSSMTCVRPLNLALARRGAQRVRAALEAGRSERASRAVPGAPLGRQKRSSPHSRRARRRPDLLLLENPRNLDPAVRRALIRQLGGLPHAKLIGLTIWSSSWTSARGRGPDAGPVVADGASGPARGRRAHGAPFVSSALLV